jgi:outer membrane protein assembly factor BamB
MRVGAGPHGACALLGLLILSSVGYAAEWPTWGRDASRNMVSSETRLPSGFEPGRFKAGTEDIDPSTTQNVRWVATLGSQAYGNPAVSGGKIFVGTNNANPRNPAIQGDRGVLLCLDSRNGRLLWQLAAPKIGNGKISDWEFLGLCSSPTVVGKRVYIVTNRCEAMCLDTDGLTNGNDGPFKDEAHYLTAHGSAPHVLDSTDADIIWRFDMREELGVFPHNITHCAPLLFDDRMVVSTSNGVDWTHTTIPNPTAAALCMLDRNTGELLGEERSGISSRTFHANWSSPAYGIAGGQEMILFGGGDGWCYGFDTAPVKEPDGVGVLKELWRYDCNPLQYRQKDGKRLKYATPGGPSEILACPVWYKNRVYVPTGQDPEHGEGVGNLVCIDAGKRGDITQGGAIWSYQKIKRAISGVSIADGLVYAADFSGFVHCLDVETGEAQWVYETKSHIWGSTLVADGKVYVGTEDGDLIVLRAGKVLKEIGKVDVRAPLYTSPVVANGVLYVMTPTHLYSIQDPSRL